MGQIDLSRILQVGALGANALALPLQAQRAGEQSAVQRALLTSAAPELGLTPEQVNQYSPDAPLQFLNPSSHPGTVGKILTGVGDVGAILSSILGSPIAPARSPLSDLSAVAHLKSAAADREATKAYRNTEIDLSRARLDQGKERIEATRKSREQTRNDLDRRAADREGHITDRVKKRADARVQADERGRALKELARRRGKLNDGSTDPEMSALADVELQRLGGVAERSGGGGAIAAAAGMGGGGGRAPADAGAGAGGEPGSGAADVEIPAEVLATPEAQAIKAKVQGGTLSLEEGTRLLQQLAVKPRGPSVRTTTRPSDTATATTTGR